MRNAEQTTLIIEDNPGDVILLKEQLNNAGWPLINSCQTGRLLEALETLTSIQPSIVFLDLNLPDSTGLDTFLAINSIAPDIPIIILSGMNDTTLSVQAVRAGAQDFLVKGEFEEKLLLKTILYGIERKKNQLRLEEANMRFQLAAKATNDPMWDWDIRANQIHWNDKVNIFGYNDEIMKNQLWRISSVHPEDKERVQVQLTAALNSGAEKWSCEYRFVCADRSVKYILDRGYIVRDRYDIPYRMIGTMHDLTERILQQERINLEKKKLQQAIIKANIDGQEKERDHISKELHDNVNQILTGTKLQLALIKKGDDPKTLPTVKKCIAYLDDAIGEIRKLARSMSPSLMKDIGVVDAITSLKNEINFLEICDIKFVSRGDFSSVPNDVSLSLFRITQEHLSNIIKHAKAHHVAISLDAEGAVLRLNIIDDGVGVNMADRKKFKGIGLLNIYNRVHSHNGIVNINSSPGNGFEIFIEIDLATFNAIK